MADNVRYVLDRLAPLFRRMEDVELLSRDEIKAVVKKVTDFEYVLKRRELEVSSFYSYLEYCIKLDKLRMHRTHRIEKAEQSKEKKDTLRNIQATFVSHIVYIFNRAVRRFPSEMQIWNDFIAFLTEKKSNSILNTVFGRVLALHPKHEEYWLKYSVHEIDTNANIHSARITMQRGLRANPHSEMLWLRYFELELWNALRTIERQDKLGITIDGDQLIGAPVVVFKHALDKMGVEQGNFQCILKMMEAGKDIAGVLTEAMEAVLIEKLGHREGCAEAVWEYLMRLRMKDALHSCASIANTRIQRQQSAAAATAAAAAPAGSVHDDNRSKKIKGMSKTAKGKDAGDESAATADGMNSRDLSTAAQFVSALSEAITQCLTIAEQFQDRVAHAYYNGKAGNSKANGKDKSKHKSNNGSNQHAVEKPETSSPLRCLTLRTFNQFLGKIVPITQRCNVDVSALRNYLQQQQASKQQGKKGEKSSTRTAKAKKDQSEDEGFESSDEKAGQALRLSVEEAVNIWDSSLQLILQVLKSSLPARGSETGGGIKDGVNGSANAEEEHRLASILGLHLHCLCTALCSGGHDDHEDGMSESDGALISPDQFGLWLTQQIARLTFGPTNTLLPDGSTIDSWVEIVDFYLDFESIAGLGGRAGAVEKLAPLMVPYAAQAALAARSSKQQWRTSSSSTSIPGEDDGCSQTVATGKTHGVVSATVLARLLSALVSAAPLLASTGAGALLVLKVLPVLGHIDAFNNLSHRAHATVQSRSTDTSNSSSSSSSSSNSSWKGHRAAESDDSDSDNEAEIAARSADHAQSDMVDTCLRSIIENLGGVSTGTGGTAGTAVSADRALWCARYLKISLNPLQSLIASEETGNRGTNDDDNENDDDDNDDETQEGSNGEEADTNTGTKATTKTNTKATTQTNAEGGGEAGASARLSDLLAEVSSVQHLQAAFDWVSLTATRKPQLFRRAELAVVFRVALAEVRRVLDHLHQLLPSASVSLPLPLPLPGLTKEVGRKRSLEATSLSAAGAGGRAVAAAAVDGELHQAIQAQAQLQAWRVDLLKQAVATCSSEGGLGSAEADDTDPAVAAEFWRALEVAHREAGDLKAANHIRWQMLKALA